MTSESVIVGLGRLGLAIGRRLADLDKRLIGIDPDDARQAEWVTATEYLAAPSLTAEVIRRARRIFVVVRTEDQVRQVIDAILALGAHTSRCHVYLVSTVTPDFAKKLANRGKGSHFVFVEFPVTGGGPAAASGRLVAMAHGLDDFEERDFLLSTLCADIVALPEPGMASTCKLLNNLLMAYQAAALAEVLQLANDESIDAKLLIGVLANGAASSHITRAIATYNDATLAKDLKMLDPLLQPPLVGVSDIRASFRKVRQLLGI